FARKLDASSFAKTKTPDVFVKFLIAEADGEFGRADVARFYQNVFDAQISERGVIVQRGAAIVPDSVFAKNVGIEAELVLVARRALLAAIKHQLLAGAVMLDVAIAVLTMQILVERTFHSLNAVVLKISEPDDVAQHHAVGINAGRVLFEINAAQTLGPQFLP